MKGQLHIYYDEEGDFLELHVGRFTKGYFRDAAPGIAHRVDEKTGKVTGIAILGFRARAARDTSISLPLTIELSA